MAVNTANWQYELVAVLCSTTGTGTLTLGAHVAGGFLTFAEAGVPDGALLRIAITDLNGGREVVEGTYTASGTTFTRDRVIRSSGSGNNSKISLSNSSIVVISGAAADFNFMNDYAQAQRTMSGGGTVSWAGTGGKLKWTARFIAIPMAQGLTTSVGYIDMTQPTSNIPSGQVYTGVARTCDSNGVILNVWEALYAAHTIGGNSTAITYFIVKYDTSFVAPPNWILVAAVNGDDGSVKTGSGVLIPSGGVFVSGTGVVFASNFSIYPGSSPANFWSMNSDGLACTIANGANQVIATGSGLVVLNDLTSTGEVGLYLIGGGFPILIGQTATMFQSNTTTPGAGKVSIGWNATNYAIYNNFGSSRSIGICALRTRAFN